MIILAIHMGHNGTAALLEGNEITAVLSQEKMDNVKNSAGFPGDAIKAILQSRNLDMDDIDEVVMVGKFVYPKKFFDYLLSSGMSHKPEKKVKVAKCLEKSPLGIVFPWVFQTLRNSRTNNIREKVFGEGEKYLHEELMKTGLNEKPLFFVDHHVCHARAAFHGMGGRNGDSSLIFTLDGGGDDLCATVTLVSQDGKWVKIAETPVNSSIGNIYSSTTRFLGMKILEHEYKVMGLAAYCKGYHLDVYHRLFDPIMSFDENNPLVFKSKFHTGDFYDYLVDNAVGERFDNIAGAVQHLLEDRVIKWIRAAIRQTGVGRIYTSGGVFMNVKLNKMIQDLPEVESAFFLPSCGDESNSIGAAYARAVEKDINVKPLNHVYLGLEYTDHEILYCAEKMNIKDEYEISKIDNMEEMIAEMLARKEVVARFSGRCEWGARALGNRSILAHPSYMESFYEVNDSVKCRDFWMPFAPTILDTAASKYLTGYNANKTEAAYMITAYDATLLGVQHLRAALHQGDHTLRPQILRKSVNPNYYKIIKKFEQITGVGAVLNTSFNLHGYPLVCTPEQALVTLKKSKLRHLAIGNIFISKK